MNVQDLQNTRWFRSGPAALGLAAGGIDTEGRMLRDVVMVQEGEALGHGVHLEAEFVESVIAYDQATYGTTGLKARLGHPTASGDTMGTQLGVFTNFRKRRKDGKMQGIADLQILQAADESPTKPGMGKWVMQMAQERPDFIMSSIVFVPSGYYQKKPNGHKKKVAGMEDYDAELPLYVDFDAEAGAQHHYTDLVEQGAATDSLFSHTANTHLLSVQVENWLNENPQITNFLKQNPEAVAKWLSRAGYSITKKMSFNLKKWLFGEDDAGLPTAEDVAQLRTALTEARDEIKALRTERDEFKTKFEEADKRASELATEAETLRKQVEQLSADLKDIQTRLSVVEKSPAVPSVGGDTPPADLQTGRAYKNTGMAKRFSKNA
jgi:methyl-accepting chemotaxis protein